MKEIKEGDILGIEHTPDGPRLVYVKRKGQRIWDLGEYVQVSPVIERSDSCWGPIGKGDGLLITLHDWRDCPHPCPDCGGVVEGREIGEPPELHFRCKMRCGYNAKDSMEDLYKIAGGESDGIKSEDVKDFDSSDVVGAAAWSEDEK